MPSMASHFVSSVVVRFCFSVRRRPVILLVFFWVRFCSILKPMFFCVVFFQLIFEGFGVVVSGFFGSALLSSSNVLGWFHRVPGIASLR